MLYIKYILLISPNPVNLKSCDPYNNVFCNKLSKRCVIGAHIKFSVRGIETQIYVSPPPATKTIRLHYSKSRWPKCTVHHLPDFASVLWGILSYASGHKRSGCMYWFWPKVASVCILEHHWCMYGSVVFFAPGLYLNYRSLAHWTSANKFHWNANQNVFSMRWNSECCLQNDSHLTRQVWMCWG